VFVVMHTSPSSPGILPRILDRSGPLPCDHANDGDTIRKGRIYVAPPDHHLILKRDRVRITHGPRENAFRPAVDPLFRTAARAFNSRVVGVVLSGGLDDGTEGLLRIKQCGGIAVVQDPTEAIFPGMPANAVRHVDVDHVVPLAQIPAILTQYAKSPIPKGAAVMSQADCPSGDPERRDITEIGNAALTVGNMSDVPPSGFTCPECGGALWELTEGGLMRYRCHVGHGYSGEGLAVEHARKLEAALWTALRALEENSAIRRRMAERSKRQKWEALAGEYERQAKDSEERAALIREVLVSDDLHVRADKDIPRRPDPEIPEKGLRRPRAARRGGNGDGNGNGNGHGKAKTAASGKKGKRRAVGISAGASKRGKRKGA
jgi:two-component system chemotaxis response regulator CheB